MRFDLDEQQRGFQSSVSDYLAAECSLRRALAPHDVPAADLGIWRGLMNLGVGGIMVPEALGGLGLGLLDLAIIAEPLGRVAAPGPFMEHALATLAVARGGTAAQQARWLPGLMSGDVRATLALAEDKGQWLHDDWRLVVEDGVLTGRKCHVLHAAGADLIVVGLASGKLGLIEGTAQGLAIETVPCTDAGKQSSTLLFTATPCEPLERASGAELVHAGLVLLAADAFGGASHCVEMATEYAQTREQFGRKIGAFQALKHQLADMALLVEPTIGLYWYAAHAFDADPAAAPLAACLAKAHITALYPRIARRMIEAHGGIGYTWEFGAHVWLKRALFDQAYLGMPHALRARSATLAGW